MSTPQCAASLQSLPHEIKEIVYISASNRELAFTCKSFYAIGKDTLVLAKLLLMRYGVWTPWGTVSSATLSGTRVGFVQNDTREDRDAMLDPSGISNTSGSATQMSRRVVSVSRFPPGRCRNVTQENWLAVIQDPDFNTDVAISVFHLHLDDDFFIQIIVEYAVMNGQEVLMRWLLEHAPAVTPLPRNTESVGSEDANRDGMVVASARPRSEGGRGVGIPQALRDRALVQAALVGEHNIISLLVSHGSNVDHEMGSSLSMASKYGHLECVDLLLNAGADVHINDEYALCWAARHGHVAVVTRLIAAGANVHARRGCPLNWASENGHVTTVSALLDADADVHANDDYALRWSCVRGHADVVRVLLAAHADVHAVQDFALRNAVKFRHPAVVSLLLDAGADVHVGQDEALQWAIAHHDVAMVELLAPSYNSTPESLIASAASISMTATPRVRLPLPHAHDQNDAHAYDTLRSTSPTFIDDNVIASDQRSSETQTQSDNNTNLASNSPSNILPHMQLLPQPLSDQSDPISSSPSTNDNDVDSISP